MKIHQYWVYIITNPTRTVLYIGVTNNLKRRVSEHAFGSLEKGKSFTSRYFCCNLIYFEFFTDIRIAIAREKTLKKWSRAKKVALIESMNPDWEFLTP
ncbi:MAG: GIY-YIG nuclease family protein [Saprospiraceae bacterium]|nr:GIY-YIG nuclease family protein [Saprospiraceae bacterium]